MFLKSERGLIDFISNIIQQDAQRNYVCTDSSRNKFHRLLETREWKEDNGAKFLNNIFNELRVPSEKYYDRVVDMLKTEENKDFAHMLLDRTKPLYFAIKDPKSKDREVIFNKVRTEIKRIASI
jgi:hypothetical protein